MTCNACGEKPKNTAKDFTKAVIEINNPETLVLLRKVVIPASMGTEEDVPAAIGKYHNVILHYEANKHTYLYSSDGIPTLLEMDVPQELIDRIDDLEENLEQEITNREGMDEELQSNIDAVAQDLEDFKNSPDVVDIVPTYAALQAYDTSKLGDNDEIRVLADETRGGASAYYRWDKTNSQWIFIGITGPYYTKSEIDTTVQGIEEDIEGVQSEIGDLSTLTTADKTSAVAAINEVSSNLGLAKVLTPADYNYPTDNPTSIALWLLEPGLYVVSGRRTVISYSTTVNTDITDSYMYLVQGGQYGTVLEMGWGTALGEGGRQLGGRLYTYTGPGVLAAHSGRNIITSDYLEIHSGVPSTTGLDYTSNGKIYIDSNTAMVYQYINPPGGANRGWVRFGAEEINPTDWSQLWQ